MPVGNVGTKTCSLTLTMVIVFPFAVGCILDVNPKSITLKPGNYSKSHLKMKTNGAECTVTALQANMKKSKKHLSQFITNKKFIKSIKSF